MYGFVGATCTFHILKQKLSAALDTDDGQMPIGISSSTSTSMKTVPAADPASTAVTINDVEEHSEVLQQKNDSDVKMQDLLPKPKPLVLCTSPTPLLLQTAPNCFSIQRGSEQQQQQQTEQVQEVLLAQSKTDQVDVTATGALEHVETKLEEGGSGDSVMLSVLSPAGQESDKVSTIAASTLSAQTQAMDIDVLGSNHITSALG